MTYTAKDMARRFHDTYERLAPSFGYETRADTRQFDEDSPNGKLMIAVCADLLEAQEGAGKIEDVHGNAACINGEWMDFHDARLILVPNTDDARDAARLDAIRSNSWDLRCFDMPTGQGDADIGWRVYAHYGDDPVLREVAVEYSDDPRKAIDAAMAEGGEG